MAVFAVRPQWFISDQCSRFFSFPVMTSCTGHLDMSTIQLEARIAIVIEKQRTPSRGAVTLITTGLAGSGKLTGVHISVTILTEAFL